MKLKELLVILLVGAGIVLLAENGIGVPCLFHVITGLKCPGCGLTRMIMAILNLDFKKAFYWNAYIFITWPIFIWMLIDRKRFETKNGSIFMMIMFATLVGWTLIRNLPLLAIY